MQMFAKALVGQIDIELLVGEEGVEKLVSMIEIKEPTEKGTKIDEDEDANEAEDNHNPFAGLKPSPGSAFI